MPEIPDEITRFLGELGSFAGRELPHRAAIAVLLLAARQNDDVGTFEELTFLAKFLSKTSSVMQRIGPRTEGYEKLAAEFKDTSERAKALLMKLLSTSPEGERQHFKDAYFKLDQQGFAAFLGLLADLGWVKNWQLDGKPLP